MSKNFLKLNVNKTQLLVCRKKRLLDTFQPNILNLKNSLNLDTDLLPKAKLLGVVLDQSLSLDHMITETCRICYFKLTKLRNLRSFLSYNHKIMLVKTFIISHINYCNSLYACLPHYLLRTLERLLNRGRDGVAKLPRPSSSAQRASRPAPDFMIYFIRNKTIIAALVGNGFLNKCYINQFQRGNTMHTLTNDVGRTSKEIDFMNQFATKRSQCPRGLIIINS